MLFNMIENLKKSFFNLISSISSEKSLKKTLWTEIELKYNHRSRSYHNLSHIKSMLDQVAEFESQIKDQQLLAFSIWYHDLIYNPLRRDNELKSANRANEVLKILGMNEERIKKCHHQILLTKKHKAEGLVGFDEKILLDFDLEILSRDWNQYELYTQKIRKEYWMYPNFLYKKGRREAMQKFLERPSIYNTSFFQSEKEEKARENIKRELVLL